MFCKNCGTQNPDGAVNCTKCGAVMDQPAPVAGGSSPLAKITADKKKLMMIGAIAVAIIAVILIFVISSGSGNSGKNPEDPVKAMLDGALEGDADVFISAFPKDMQAIIKKDGNSYRSLKKSLNETKKMQKEEGIKANYKIVGKEKLDKDRVNMAEESYNMIMAMYNKKSDAEFTDGYSVEVEMITEQDGDKDTQTQTFTVYEVDGKWYTTDLSGMMF